MLYNDSTNNIGLNWVWLGDRVHKKSLKTPIKTHKILTPTQK